MLTAQSFSSVGFDAIALKPTECDVSRAAGFEIDTITIDYEGREHLPSRDTLDTLTEHATVYLTTPVRANGFDPLGDSALADWMPDEIGRVFVAGNAAYLSDEERSRAVAPRLEAALASSRSTAGPAPCPWVGTEGIERLALAAGGVQYDLLSRHTLSEVRALRSVGYDGEIAVYAPTVLSDDDDVILDAVGGYVARRKIVRRAIAKASSDTTTDAATESTSKSGSTTAPVTDRRATGQARDILLTAAQDFALVGNRETVRERIRTLHDAGVDTVVSYPATGLTAFE
ncbi:LLM class flavin-dependent oxidoreductase [Halocatena marina]|uniref:LLM class flavin-dependent oxidoreductase n=1 Tax=Halocatena marina TaxID=2934937 RepID=UPI00200DCA48|nr:LLM class flavin-dependent oxidoreductase [Halocatena marina]